MPLKFDNIMQRFTKEPRGIFFDTVEACGAVDIVGFTANDLSYMEEVLTRFPSVQIHYDGTVDLVTLQMLSARVPPQQLTIWMRFDNPATAWNTTPPVSEDMAEMIHRIGKLGV